MPWEEYRTRVLRLTGNVLALEGAMPSRIFQAEAEALFGHQADNFLRALDGTPAICSRCERPHQGYGPHCYECAEKVAAEEREAEIRADERAKVRAELAQKGGA